MRSSRLKPSTTLPRRSYSGPLRPAVPNPAVRNPAIPNPAFPNPQSFDGRSASIQSPNANGTLWLTVALLISHFGRIFEMVLVGWHIPAVICSLGILVAYASGSLKRLNSPPGIAVTCLIAWMMFSAPQSTWRTGSLTYVIWYVIYWITLMLLAAQAPRSAKDITRIAFVIGLSCIISIFFGNVELDGRLGSSFTFGNPDDVALSAGFAIPFVVLSAIQFQNVFLRFAVMIPGVSYLTFIMFRTATRAAVPALILMVGVYFFHSKALHKIVMVIGIGIAAVGMLFVLPQATIERLATIVDSLDSNRVEQLARAGDNEAMSSTAERRDLLADAIKMTLDNPILGVGPGEFPDYRRENLTYPNGRPKRGVPSHNTFAQIAAETGIPGLLFYVVFLATIFGAVRRVRKLIGASGHPDTQRFSQIATCLQAALFYFAACAFFMTCDRHPQQFVIAGLAISVERLLLHWMSQKASPPHPAGQGLNPFAPNGIRRPLAPVGFPAWQAPLNR